MLARQDIPNPAGAIVAAAGTALVNHLSRRAEQEIRRQVANYRTSWNQGTPTYVAEYHQSSAVEPLETPPTDIADRSLIRKPEKRKGDELGLDAKRKDSGESTEEEDAPAPTQAATEAPTNAPSEAAPTSASANMAQGGDNATPGANALSATLPSALYTGTTLRRKKYRTVNHFTIPITDLTNSEVIKVGDCCFGIENGWIGFPWKSSAFYMNEEEAAMLNRMTLGYRFIGAGFKISNFTTHTGNMAGTGTPQVNMNYGGVGFLTCVGSSTKLGKYFISAKDGMSVGEDPSKPVNHDSVHREMSEVGRQRDYTEYKFRITQVLENVHTGGLSIMKNTEDKLSAVKPEYFDAGVSALEVTNLADHSVFTLDAPAVTQFTAIPTQKHWYSGRLTRDKVTHMYLPKDSAAGSYNAFYNMYGHHFVSSEFTQQQIFTNHMSTTPGNTQQYHFLEGLFTGTRYGASDFVNIMPQQTTPLMKFMSTQIAATNKTNPNHIGNASPYHCDDFFAFRPMVPPKPDGTSPQINICFTVESECEVEYVDIMSHETTGVTRFFQSRQDLPKLYVGHHTPIPLMSDIVAMNNMRRANDGKRTNWNHMVPFAYGTRHHTQFPKSQENYNAAHQFTEYDGHDRVGDFQGGKVYDIVTADGYNNNADPGPRIIIDDTTME